MKIMKQTLILNKIYGFLCEECFTYSFYENILKHSYFYLILSLKCRLVFIYMQEKKYFEVHFKLAN